LNKSPRQHLPGVLFFSELRFEQSKKLIADMTINAAMLIYLNGESNKARTPNENFGRELFELFTIGKGPLIAEGI
jgi:uncharacterized protein (DUF1800 family)